MCKKVRDLVHSDRRIQVEEIAQALGISHGSIPTILYDHLGMRKLTARWVPKSLSDEQMATGASVCSALLKRFRSKDDFLLRLVTVDETWVYWFKQYFIHLSSHNTSHNVIWYRIWVELRFIIMSQRIKLRVVNG